MCVACVLRVGCEVFLRVMSSGTYVDVCGVCLVFGAYEMRGLCLYIYIYIYILRAQE